MPDALVDMALDTALDTAFKLVAPEEGLPAPVAWQGLVASASPLVVTKAEGSPMVTVTWEKTVVVTVETDWQLVMPSRGCWPSGPAKASCARTSAVETQCLSISCGSERTTDGWAKKKKQTRQGLSRLVVEWRVCVGAVADVQRIETANGFEEKAIDRCM